MNTLTDLLLGVGQPRVSHFPDLCTLLYTYLSTLDYWTKIVYYLFTQTSPVAHTSALTPTYIKSQKLPNWPISKELGLGRMLLPHWKLLLDCGKIPVPACMECPNCTIPRPHSIVILAGGKPQAPVENMLGRLEWEKPTPVSSCGKHAWHASTWECEWHARAWQSETWEWKHVWNVTSCGLGIPTLS